eukprot:1158362-Pelagomonas_calceolata.AAC.7
MNISIRRGFNWLTAGINFSIRIPNLNLAARAATAAAAGAATACCCCWRAADAVGGYADADAATGKLAQAWKSCQKWSYMREREPQKECAFTTELSCARARAHTHTHLTEARLCHQSSIGHALHRLHCQHWLVQPEHHQHCLINIASFQHRKHWSPCMQHRPSCHLENAPRCSSASLAALSWMPGPWQACFGSLRAAGWGTQASATLLRGWSLSFGPMRYGISRKRVKRGQGVKRGREGDYKANKPNCLTKKFQAVWCKPPNCPLREHWQGRWSGGQQRECGEVPQLELVCKTSFLYRLQNVEAHMSGKKHKECAAAWQQTQRGKASWQQLRDKGAKCSTRARRTGSWPQPAHSVCNRKKQRL